MRSAYDILTKVNFSHSYFHNGVFAAFDIKASDATNKLMKDNSLVLKPVNGGFYIFYDQQFANATRTRDEVLNEKFTLHFTLTLKDQLFYNYTADAPAQIDQSLYFFNNILNPAGLLQADEFVSENDAQPLSFFTEAFFVKPFAKVILAVNQNLQSEYAVKFKARSTYWRYILMSNYLQDLNSPAVIDADNTGAFGEVSKMDLPDSRQVSAFTSGSTLQLSQRPGKSFQLAENYEKGSSKYKVVIRALPYPDISAISRLSNNSSSNYSDIFIY